MTRRLPLEVRRDRGAATTALLQDSLAKVRAALERDPGNQDLQTVVASLEEALELRQEPALFLPLDPGEVCPWHGADPRFVDRCSPCEVHGAPVGFRLHLRPSS